MEKNLLKKPIELLLKDEHQKVVWGEKIPEIKELEKEISWLNPNAKREGYVSIIFEHDISRLVLESVLGDEEKILDGEKGILTKKGYQALVYHIESAGKTIFRVEGKKAYLPIYADGMRNYVDSRAVEILDSYLQLGIEISRSK